MYSVKVGSYTVGSSRQLTTAEAHALVLLLEQPVRRGEGPLGGRGGIGVGEVPGFGRVVVKHYMRGGLLRFITARWYLRIGRIRPAVEFELLEQVRALGVAAPEPVAFAWQGGVWYRGWLFTREIPEHHRLSERCQEARKDLREIMQEVARQLRLLIQHRVLHVDLHPGNVLIDRFNKVHIVDFDNARPFLGSERDLREVYLRRWRRAVIKHGLSEPLSELMALELRQVAPEGR